MRLTKVKPQTINHLVYKTDNLVIAFQYIMGYQPSYLDFEDGFQSLLKIISPVNLAVMCSLIEPDVNLTIESHFEVLDNSEYQRYRYSDTAII